MLINREREVLNCMLASWDADGAPLSGHLSYFDVLQVVEKLGLNRPVRLEAFISVVDNLK